MTHIHISAILIVVVVPCLLSAFPASAKTGSTLYTPERIANARRNIERCEWAREIRDRAVAQAEKYVNQRDDFLWDLVTPQDIPRGIDVNREHGCPKCGKDILRFGEYNWKIDVIHRPWKIECPSCGEVFPKNDFAQYYESGKDQRGIFHLERGDRSLLVNADHPDPKDPLHLYGVDDGLGWKSDDGSTYRFIGYYGHYGSWAAVLYALGYLRDAYIYTGDTRYARKAGILLSRSAEFYPDMDYGKWAQLGFFNSDGGSGKGKVYGRIWETGVAKTLITAYDAIYPGLDDPALLAYLSAKTNRLVDATSLRSLVEKNIIHGAHDSILRSQIAGNEGMYQAVMAIAAVVLDEPDTTKQWLDWLFEPGDVRHGDGRGGNIPGLFDKRISDDGMGDEASPTYNGLWRGRFREMSEILERYPRYQAPRITAFPKYRKMFETPVRLICLDRFIPNIGDTGRTGWPHLGGIRVDELVYAYRTFREPVYAQMAYYLNGGTADGICGASTRPAIPTPASAAPSQVGPFSADCIFELEPEAVAKEIEAVVKEHGAYVPKTENLPSYGLAILRGGTGENQRALTLYYGRNLGHGHKDTLNIELFGHGLDLMPDIGYPEYATTWPARSQWTSNTISHNTVVVDRAKQGDSELGLARFVKEGRGASAAEVYADKVYPQSSLYQRTIAMVAVSENDFYVVDIFRVRGGKEHHYSLHGPEGEIETEGLNLVAQSKGTLAGEDIPLAADLGGRETYWRTASGFQYLYDIQRDAHPAAQVAVTWNVKDTWRVLKEPKDLRLRVTLLDAPGEVTLAHGDPPQNKLGNPRRLTYLVLGNQASDSTFVSLIEPYEGERNVKRIERSNDGDTVMVKVALASGRTDYVVSSTEPKTKTVGSQDFVGRFGIISEDSGRRDVRLAVD